jgi:hypothetical protein
MKMSAFEDHPKTNPISNGGEEAPIKPVIKSL